MYSRDQIEHVIQKLKDAGIAREISDGALIAEIPEKKTTTKQENKIQDEKCDNKEVTVRKRDGSTLYISRDIAAVLDRVPKYNFDKMFYVVENGQSEHFQNLFALTKRLLLEKKRQERLHLEHVKFGRIQGM